MGMQYIDVIHQNEKLRKKNKELELKNASLTKENKELRERQERLMIDLERLERRDIARRSTSDLTDMFTLAKFMNAMVTNYDGAHEALSRLTK